MRIDAITSCSGQTYFKYLANSLPIWLDTLDSVTIVTKPEDHDVLSLSGPSNLRILTTNIFTEHGACFNKGAALNCAYATSNPSDWVLHFDADIIPPNNWRTIAENNLEPGFLYGCSRSLYKRDITRSIIRKFSWPAGFFQMWYSRDSHSFGWPLFTPLYIHCGRSDYIFYERWGPDRIANLPLVVDHYGPTYTNWFGVKNRKQMNIFKGKHRKIRMSQLSDFVLELPPPNLRILIESDDPEWIKRVLKICQKGDLFKVEVKVRNGSDIEGFTNWTKDQNLDTLEELVLSTLERREECEMQQM